MSQVPYAVGVGRDSNGGLMSVAAGEWRWVAICAGATLAMVVLPYSIALLLPPEGRLLGTTLFYGFDTPNYLAAIGDGMESSSWLVIDHFTSEPHQPTFMFPLYVALGKTAALLGLSSVQALALGMALAVLALVFAAYAFAAAFIESVSERRVALVLILFASGLGIWIAAAMPPSAGGDPPTRGFSFERAEVSTYLLFFGPPHLTLALALLLLWGRALARWVMAGSDRLGPLVPPGAGGDKRVALTRLPLLVLLSLGVGLLNYFSLASLVAVAGSYALVCWVSRGRFPLREVGAALLVGGILAPLLVHSLLTFALDPFWSAVYNRQNPVRSAPPWMLGIDFGLLLFLALVGVARGGARRESRLFLAIWIVTLLTLIYLPVPFQRRFGYGLQPALAVLGAMGAGWIDRSLRAGPPRSLWRVPAVALGSILAFGGMALGYAVLVMAAQGAGGLGQIVFEPRSHMAAVEWLARNSGASDVVLCTIDTGNFLGGRIRGRVVLGHPGVTLDPQRKETLVRAFFSPSATPSERARVVAGEGVTLVFLGQRERALGGVALPPEEGYRLEYESEGVQIYRVAPSG